MNKVLLWCHRRSEPVAHIRPLDETSITCGAGISSISPWACLEHQMDYGWDEIWKNTCKTFYKTALNLQITKICLTRERFLFANQFFLVCQLDNTTIFLPSISSPSTNKINVKITVLVILVFFFSPLYVRFPPCPLWRLGSVGWLEGAFILNNDLLSVRLRSSFVGFPISSQFFDLR